MRLRVDPMKWTDVSEERIASIFRVEKSASEEQAWAGSMCSWEDNIKMGIKQIRYKDVNWIHVTQDRGQ
jgi:hypothetical protein